MTALSPFDEAVIDGVAAVIGETNTGFSGSDIASLLQRSGIPDPGEITKRHRVSQALHAEQTRTNAGNCLIALITTAMELVRWSGNQLGFDGMRRDLNAVLAYAGLEADGRIHKRAVAQTHDQAVATSRRLRDELQRRQGHAEVSRYCTRELVADDCFGAVFEATKGLAERIRQMTGLDLDGHRLVDTTLGLGGAGPMVAFNSLRTDTERNEQNGLSNIPVGTWSHR